MMKIQQAKVGQTIKDRCDGHTIKITKIGTNQVYFTVLVAPIDRSNIPCSDVGHEYSVAYNYAGNVWKLVDDQSPVKKPVTKLDILKKELEQAKANVTKIETAIEKIHESLALKPGTMYKSEHFNGQPAIFMCENNGDHEFYLGGEFRNIEVEPDDLEKFQPMTLPNQRKMAKAVVAFIEGRIPNN